MIRTMILLTTAVIMLQANSRPVIRDIDYTLQDKTIMVTRCGRICLGRKEINLDQCPQVTPSRTGKAPNCRSGPFFVFDAVC